MSSAEHNTLSRRRWLARIAVLGTGIATSPAQAQLFKGLFMNNNNPETATMKWDVSFCRYGIDIEPRGQGDVTTLSNNNWMKDAQGQLVAMFYTGFGAAWGAGSTGMGGAGTKASRLPKTLRLKYYDYLEDRFYQLDAELPIKRIHEIFFRAPRIIDKDVNYGTVRSRYDDTREHEIHDTDSHARHMSRASSRVFNDPRTTHDCQKNEACGHLRHNADDHPDARCLRRRRW